MFQLFFLIFTLTIIYWVLSSLFALCVSYCIPVGIIIAQQEIKFTFALNQKINVRYLITGRHTE